MEKEEYYLVYSEKTGLQIVDSIERYMIENEVDICEVSRYTDIDECLDDFTSAYDKLEELKEK